MADCWLSAHRSWLLTPEMQRDFYIDIWNDVLAWAGEVGGKDEG